MVSTGKTREQTCTHRSQQDQASHSLGGTLRPRCEELPPCLPTGARPHSPRLQWSSSVTAPGWHQDSLGSKGERDGGLTTGWPPPPVSSAPCLGVGSSPGDPIGGLCHPEQETPDLLHPLHAPSPAPHWGAHTWSFHKTSLILSFLCSKKRKKKKRGGTTFHHYESLGGSAGWSIGPVHRKAAGSIPRGVCLGGNQCFSLPSSLLKKHKQANKNQRAISSGG